jgi:hypothetical protein
MNKTAINFIQSNPCNCTINTRLGSVWKNCYLIEKEQNLKDCSFKYLADHLEESAKKCKEYCPLECESVSYSFAIEQNNENPGSSLYVLNTYKDDRIKYDELKYT